MNGLLHSLQIGTLAAWLSVAGFGTMALIYPDKPIRVSRLFTAETQVLSNDFELGGDTSADLDAQENDSLQPEAQKPASQAAPDPLPTPPDLPAVAETPPLPAIPAFPVAKANPAPRGSPPTQPHSRSTTSSPRPATAARPGKPKSSASTAARLAAGHMPAPNYPAEARRRGQTGTVVVQFTVGSDGRVTYAGAIEPSPWPLLNQEAIRTVRRWKFPPGDIMSLARPIVFKLK